MPLVQTQTQASRVPPARPRPVAAGYAPLPNERLVFLLEDNADRVREMAEVLEALLPQHNVVVYARADEAVSEFDRLQPHIELCSLDHDLLVEPDDDAGDGRTITDAMACRAATCAVIVHTSNAPAGNAMVHTLQLGDWPVWRVYPLNDLAWIAGEWKATIQKLIVLGYVKP
jgi:CheY-like chemotaxis protein